MQSDVIGDAIGRILVGADIDADDARTTAAVDEAQARRIEAVAVEAEAVDHSLVAREPEHPRAGIAFLRLRHHAAEFDEAEAEAEKLIGHFALLVEARRKTDGIGEVPAEHVDGQARIVRRRRRHGHQRQRADRQLMRGLGVERVKSGFGEGEERADHGVEIRKDMAPVGAEGKRLHP